ncbi:kinesin motor domain-containing protein [Cryptosporidium muris RN66]|uniref:Kinesin-like protein n=1 Tax=Cryptosporidium muris (strain RN66) TaxID=441375 RepID=B6AG72_CRYMR|nr:kinesin motor domain-containing protein [Cryptosporidium muris RN66]EEA07213.1 kinesin motor domain-containing protein [Cryptosporidium muris RN66]|eukprot:XP_002141562.1 kinesin motor domain-containing protein [Cryptosporidium muris RN66]
MYGKYVDKIGLKSSVVNHGSPGLSYESYQEIIENLEKEQKLVSNKIEELENNSKQLSEECSILNKKTELVREKEKEDNETLIKIMEESEESERLYENLQVELKNKINELETRIEQLSNDLEYEKSVGDNLKSQCKDLESIKLNTQANLNILTEKLKIKYWANSARLSLAQQIELANQEILSWKYRLQRCAANINNERKKLFNMVQEIRGNIRVFCRIRPLLPSENKDSCIQYDISEDDSTITIKNNGNRGSSISAFSFDRIFLPKCSQQDVFEEVSQLIQSALDGYNVCIFSYGQTGSGKTHTMLGTPKDEDIGMIPRALNLIFSTIKDMKTKGWNYRSELSAMEVYNENVRDLLQESKGKQAPELRLDQKGGISITGLYIKEVTNAEQVNKMLSIAQGNRAAASTDSNERSSRSHSIIQLKLIGEFTSPTQSENENENFLYSGQKTNYKVTSTLSLVDLAGSERVNKSNVTGDRLKETQYINRSLSSLRDVILAIALKKDHIPYRNSKLTMLLKDSLGGNSKTAMFVHISPVLSSYSESLSSLRFATTVQTCEINCPKRQHIQNQDS